MQHITDENRKKIVDAYCARVVEDMSVKDLAEFVYENLHETKSKYTNAELETEVSEYYPALLEK